jgi:hypothetical protein
MLSYLWQASLLALNLCLYFQTGNPFSLFVAGLIGGMLCSMVIEACVGRCYASRSTR